MLCVQQDGPGRARLARKTSTTAIETDSVQL